MATFYLLPTRLTLGHRFGEFLSGLFPTLRWNRDTWFDLAEILGTAAGTHPDVYTIFREDLTHEDDLEGSLVHDFGAVPGDDVVEVHALDGVSRRWRVGICAARDAA